MTQCIHGKEYQIGFFCLACDMKHDPTCPDLKTADSSEPTDVGDLENLLNTLSSVHAKYRDGCKGSCGEREIGFHHSDFYDSYWFMSFGGYCLGTLPRRVTIQAPTLTELKCKLDAVLAKAIIENQNVEGAAAEYPEIER